MRSITHSAILPAPPDKVFALLERVEDFAEYSDLITAIEPLGEERYHWHVHAVGMDWTFAVQITEKIAPTKLAWESTEGIHNQGHYNLEAVDEGTRVTLTLEYQIRNRLLAKAVDRAARPLVAKVSKQILERVEARL